MGRQAILISLRSRMKLSVIVPIYNERQNLLRLIEMVEKVPIEKEIIAVDDYSTDGSREILKGLENKIRMIYHSKKRNCYSEWIKRGE